MESTSGNEPTRSDIDHAENEYWAAVARQAVDYHRAMQHPAELAELLRTAASIKPKTILEIGTYYGGTAWAWAEIPTVERIITIDRYPKCDINKVISPCDIEVRQVCWDSTAPATREYVEALLDGRPVDVLFIDGCHDLATVTADWQSFGHLARGGLVAFHDITPHRMAPGVKVHELWAKIVASHRFTAEYVAEPGVWAGTGIVWL